MTTFTRRSLAALPLAAALPGAASAQSAPWPSRPPRWVLPWAAGGSSDFVGRIIAQAASARIGQPIVVENRTGGATVPATEFVTRQPADGYTLFQGDITSLVFTPAMADRLPYNVERDLRIVHGMARFPYMVIVHPDVPARTMAEFLALARVREGAVSMSHAGAGSPNHLAIVRLERATGVRFTQVAYRGGAPALADTIAGVVQSCMTDVATAVGAIQAGRVRAIATCQPSRVALFPDVPTLAEQGIRNADIYAWNCLCVPSATPERIVQRLEAEVRLALQDAALIERFRGLALEANMLGTAEMAALWRQALATWPPLIRELGIRLDT